MDDQYTCKISCSPGSTITFIPPLTYAHDQDDNDAKCVMNLQHPGISGEDLSFQIRNLHPAFFKYIARPKCGTIQAGSSASVKIILSEVDKQAVFGPDTRHCNPEEGRQAMADSISIEWNSTPEKRQPYMYTGDLAFKILSFAPLMRGGSSTGIINMSLKYPDAAARKSTQEEEHSKSHFAFKVKLTRPSGYTVRPVTGVLPPGSRKLIKISIADTHKKAILDEHDRNGLIPEGFQADKVLIQFIPIKDSLSRSILTKSFASAIDGGEKSKDELNEAFQAGWEDACKCFKISEQKIVIRHTVASTSSLSPSQPYPSLELKLSNKLMKISKKKSSKKGAASKKSPQKIEAKKSTHRNIEEESHRNQTQTQTNAIHGEIMEPIPVATPIPYDRPVVVTATVVNDRDIENSQAIPNETAVNDDPPNQELANATPSDRISLILKKLGLYEIEFKLTSMKAKLVGFVFIVPVFVLTWAIGLSTFAMIHAIFFVPQWNHMKEEVENETIGVIVTREFLREVHHTSSDSGGTTIRYAYEYKYSYIDPETNQTTRFKTIVESSSQSILDDYMHLVVLPRAPNMPYRTIQLKPKGLIPRCGIFFAGAVGSTTIIFLYTTIFNNVLWAVLHHLCGAILSPLVFLIQKQFFLCHWNTRVGTFTWDPC